MIEPKLHKVLHFTGEFASTPSCPLKVVYNYNPSKGSNQYRHITNCTEPASLRLPFFLEKYGPKYWDWSLNGHETRPGHHINVQGKTMLLYY